MENEIGDLRGETIEETLKRVQGFSGSWNVPPGHEALIIVTAKCAIDLLKGLGRTADEIRAFNECTGALTRQIIRLNRWLTAATIVGAIATLVIAASTAPTIWRALCALSQRILSG